MASAYKTLSDGLIPEQVLRFFEGRKVTGAGVYPYSASVRTEFEPEMSIAEGLAWISKAHNDSFLDIGEYTVSFERFDDGAGLRFVDVEDNIEDMTVYFRDLGEVEGVCFLSEDGVEEAAAVEGVPLRDNDGESSALWKTIPKPVRSMLEDFRANGAGFSSRVIDDVTPIVGFRYALTLAAATAWLDNAAHACAFLTGEGYTLFFADNSFARLTTSDGSPLFENGRPVLRMQKESIPEPTPEPEVELVECEQEEVPTTEVETPPPLEPLIDTIPQSILAIVGGVPVRQAGVGAGPGCCVGTSENFAPRRSLQEGLAWIEKYRSSYTLAHVDLVDGTRLIFTRFGLHKHMPNLELA